MYICIAMWKFRYMYGQCACKFEKYYVTIQQNVFCNMLRNDLCFQTLLCI